MPSQKLKDRVESYIDASDYKLISRLPIIININGRGFSKITSLIDKPHCSKFMEAMLSTMLKLCSDLEGVLFAFQSNDEITLILRNDQNNNTEPFLNNKLQKICSIASSIATLHFNNYTKSIDLNLIGEPLFTSQVFVVPNIAEAMNVLIFKQQQSFYLSIQFACFYELLKKYDKNTIKEMLNGLNSEEKIDLLNQECGIDFHEYSSTFKRGAAAYKIPKIVDGVLKNRWYINTDIPIFAKDQVFITSVLKNGSDIFRKDSV